jgi:hypothetical protein
MNEFSMMTGRQPSRFRDPVAALLGVLLLTLAGRPAQAEEVTLVDNTRIIGKFIHYFDGELTLETTGGARVKLPASKIRSIRFELPKPRAEFATPEKTFQRWKQYLHESKLPEHIDCYALMYQMMMTTMLGSMTKDELDKMVKGHRATRYEVRGTRFQGKTMAFLKVAATLPGGKEPQVGELLFIKENGEWKLVPPQFQRPPGAT